MTGKKVRNFTYGLAPVTFLIAVTPANINEFFTLGDICSYIQLFIIIIIVPLALGVAWLRNRLFPTYKR